MLKDKNSNIPNLKTLLGFPILVLENEWEYYISISHSVNICNKPVIISYSFGDFILRVEYGHLFPYYDCEFDMETDVFAQTAVCG